MTDLAALVVRMQADNSQYIKALDEATGKLKKFSDDQNSLFGSFEEKLSDIAGELAAAFSVDAIAEFSMQAIEAQASMAKMSQETGIGVDKLSVLNVAFAAAGLSSDETAMAMKKLGQSVSDAAGDPMSKAAIAFKSLGLNIQDISKQDLSVTLGQLGDKFKDLADGPNKTALAIALLGRQGQTLIPVLNSGSEGLDKFAQSAADSGAVLSGEAAEAAEALEQKLGSLKKEAVQGLGNAIAGELIPALNLLADTWAGGTGKADAYKVIAEGIAFAFKSLATIGLEIGREFETIGSAIGGAAAAVGAALTGDFAGAKAILTEQHEDMLAIEKKYSDATAKLWESSADREVAAAAGAAESKEKGAGAKPDAPNLAAAEATAKADEELKKYAATMKEQSEAFGLGAEASAKFRLETGSLGEAMGKASAEGKAAAAQAIKYAEALQFKKDLAGGDKMIAGLIEQADTLNVSARAAFTYKLNVGDLGNSLNRLATAGHDLRPALEAAFDLKLVAQDNEAVQKLNDQLATMNGHLIDAAGHSFDLSNRSLKQNLSDTGDTAGQASLDKLRDATIAQAAYNEQVEKAQKIEQDYATAVATVNLARAQGAITDLAADKLVNDAQLAQITNLQAVYAAEKKISDDSGLPKLAQDTQAFANQITNLKTQTDQLTTQVRNNLETSFANNFADLMNGSESFRKAFLNMGKDIEKQMDDIVSKDFAQNIFGQQGPGGGIPSFLANILGGSSSSSGGSGGLAGLMSLFGGGSGAGIASTANAATGQSMDSLIASVPGLAGGFAEGGTIPSGKYGIVGENGPELAYAGSGPLQIQPSGGSAKQVVQNVHFHVTSTNGTISRPTQTQTAATAARQLNLASRRNN